jgi:hypothetical protein
MKKIIIYAFLFLFLSLWLPVPVLAQSGIQVKEDEAVLGFPDGITFQLKAVDDTDIQSVVLVYGSEGRTCISSAARQSIDFTPSDQVALDWEWEWKRSGIIPPGTLVWWYWEITDAINRTLTTPRQELVVQDPRHNWSVLESGGVTVQWVQGDASFGDRLHRIAVDSLYHLSKQMGVRPTGDVYIIVYPTSDDVQETLLVSTDWTGGVALPAYDSTIIGVGPQELDWAALIIPHELSHLVVGTLTFNCRGVYPPTWLNEGLSEMAEGSLSQVQGEQLLSALEEDDLPPLKSLENGFSAYGDEARLSYVYSGYIVQFMLEEYGVDKMASLLASIQEGNLIDTALEVVYGFDTYGLDAAWRDSMGFPVSERPTEVSTGPTNTPTLVPTLPLINPGFLATATPRPSPTQIPPTPTITSTTTLIPQPTPTAPSEATDPPAEATGTPVRTSVLVWGGVILTLLLLAVGLTVYFMKRRQ